MNKLSKKEILQELYKIQLDNLEREMSISNKANFIAVYVRHDIGHLRRMDFTEYLEPEQQQSKLNTIRSWMEKG